MEQNTDTISQILQNLASINILRLIIVQEVPPTTTPRENKQCPEVEAVSIASLHTKSHGKNEQKECHNPKPSQRINILFLIKVLP